MGVMASTGSREWPSDVRFTAPPAARSGSSTWHLRSRLPECYTTPPWSQNATRRWGSSWWGPEQTRAWTPWLPTLFPVPLTGVGWASCRLRGCWVYGREALREGDEVEVVLVPAAPFGGAGRPEDVAVSWTARTCAASRSTGSYEHWGVLRR